MDLSNLFTSTGKVNTAIIRRKWFLESEQYQKILDESRDLNVFDGVSIADRIWYIADKLSIGHCTKCGKPHIEFVHSQHNFQLCRHKQKLSNRTNYCATMISRKEQLVDSVKTHPLCYFTDEEIVSMIGKLPKNDNYNFIVTEENEKLYHDILVKTVNLLPLPVDCNENFEFAERYHIVSHGLTSLPVCQFCGSSVSFINRFSGYRKCCNKCINKLARETRFTNHKEQIDAVFDFSKYDIVSYPSLFNEEPLVIKCKKCGHTSETWLYNGRLENLKNKPLCRNCELSVSKPETELYDMCCKIVGASKVLHNDRKTIAPRELDIYIPERKFAIEFNGTYWHSNARDVGPISDYKTRHLKKTECCEKLGIKLFHVFEHDWETKRSIVMSIIKNQLGMFDRTVYARNCRVNEIDSATCQKFLNENHLQGACNSKVRLGLFSSDNELVSVMTFSKPRFDKKHEWELVRFCSRLGYHIPGGASRLLSWFEKTYHPTGIVSYADRSRSDGNLYRQLGFSFDHASSPDYKYINRSGKVVGRILAQKHRLPKLLGDKFDPLLSESMNMKNAGYSKIYDCGNLVYVKTYDG